MFLIAVFDIFRNFSTSTNNIQARITKTFTHAIQSDKAALATQYGAIAGLGEMGSEVRGVGNHRRAQGDGVRGERGGESLKGSGRWGQR